MYFDGGPVTPALTEEAGNYLPYRLCKQELASCRPSPLLAVLDIPCISSVIFAFHKEYIEVEINIRANTPSVLAVTALQMKSW
jgi:hypothetical protein